MITAHKFVNSEKVKVTANLTDLVIRTLYCYTSLWNLFTARTARIQMWTMFWEHFGEFGRLWSTVCCYFITRIFLRSHGKSLMKMRLSSTHGTRCILLICIWLNVDKYRGKLNSFSKYSILSSVPWNTNYTAKLFIAGMTALEIITLGKTKLKILYFDLTKYFSGILHI